MDAQGLRKRPLDTSAPAKPIPNAAITDDQPEKHGSSMQATRLASLVFYFFVSGICLHFQQFLGVPLYWYNQDWYYAWQAFTKRQFGIVLITLQEWWSPMKVRVSGDKSIQGQIRLQPNGRLRLDFPERIIIVSNHQLYIDWLFMWWAAFTAKMHGHIFIILKDSLRFIPMLGPGMMFFSFLFLSRHWETDKPRFQHRLRKLKQAHRGPLSGSGDLDPMWLLIFPEGTTLSTTGRESSRKWAEKTGIKDTTNVLLPRSRGLQYCIQELEGTIDYIYDCTVAYNGLPKGKYGQDYFTLRGTYLEGRGPPYCNMHWRRFAVSSIPVHDEKAFDNWLHERWVEKDTLLEHFTEHGQFPCDEAAIVVEEAEEKETAHSTGVNGNGVAPSAIKREPTDPVCSSVSPNHPLEFVQVFSSALAVPLAWKLGKFVWLVVRIALLIASFGQLKF
ncbi:acyltransferase-like protein [Microthyrium microscopicum]|uniref:Acyltransferase-like protein n=1 Tax=Microthyrium microscopicum TaxID=703497 RepID=A0A6A6UC52_9PEZI|nr:acyltransferase-like protein [Microthyrium microscopicum]